MMHKAMLLWVLLPLGAAPAQPAFDVASVKPGGSVRSDGLLEINLGNASHGTVTLTNTTLSECIRYAYGLTNEEQIAGPEWIRDRQIRFTIIAKAPAETPIGQIRLMMQTLLAERFHLALHREPRKIAHFDLAIAKGGPKLRESKPETPAGRVYYGVGRLAYNHISMDRFVVLLSRQIKQPVFDRTELKGSYDVDLEWTPDNPPPGAPVETGTAPKPDLFSAVQQQLGLKLERAKEPIEVLIVDRAEKVPVAN
jgi:bla regulator protein blaR1